MSKRQLTGSVVSDKMDKTVVVEVESVKEHKKYRRRVRRHQRYKAHDAANEYKAGEKVVIEETRPLSAEKRWRVLRRA